MTSSWGPKLGSNIGFADQLFGFRREPWWRQARHYAGSPAFQTSRIQGHKLFSTQLSITWSFQVNMANGKAGSFLI